MFNSIPASQSLTSSHQEKASPSHASGPVVSWAGGDQIWSTTDPCTNGVSCWNGEWATATTINIPAVGGGRQVREVGARFPAKFLLMTEACNGFVLGAPSWCAVHDCSLR